jgi:uncharacterized LabA/DUF88 family protein
MVFSSVIKMVLKKKTETEKKTKKTAPKEEVLKKESLEFEDHQVSAADQFTESIANLRGSGDSGRPMRFGDRRPMRDDRRPMGDNRRPMDRRPMGDAPPRPIGDSTRPIGDSRRPMDRRPMGDNRRPMGDSRRPIGDNRRPAGADLHASVEEIRPSNEGRRPLNAIRRQMSDVRPAIGDSIAPENGSAAAETRRPFRDKPSHTALKRSLPVHNAQRVGVFIDVQNMYYSAKHLYNAKVNFKAVLEEGVKGRELIRAIAYGIKADIKEEGNFFEALENIGFEVRTKDLQVFVDGSKKGDWDVGIAMDAMRLAPKLDVVVLVSGDGDFRELVEYLKSSGCRVEVMAFNKTASSRLVSVADAFTDLVGRRFLIK